MLNVEHSWKRRRLMVNEDSQENGSHYDGMSLTNANASWQHAWNDLMEKTRAQNPVWSLNLWSNMATKKITNDGEDKVPDGEEKVPDGEEKVPDGEDKIPDGDDKVPDGEDKVPDGEDKVPEGENKVPEGENKVPEGEDKVPDGDDKVPD
ncbi:Hypothetical predicted protein [Paramuricea clavata]|uniref:Uncharacterized protein n=1 Tax=Paramuricea clavata TaxID=317549 RepID=A0A7D9IAX5_PARCT|nr:Hypothetical predicted protein [Paramuricea clavata]